MAGASRCSTACSRPAGRRLWLNTIGRHIKVWHVHCQPLVFHFLLACSMPAASGSHIACAAKRQHKLNMQQKYCICFELLHATWLAFCYSSLQQQTILARLRVIARRQQGLSTCVAAGLQWSVMPPFIAVLDCPSLAERRAAPAQRMRIFSYWGPVLSRALTLTFFGCADPAQYDDQTHQAPRLLVQGCA